MRPILAGLILAVTLPLAAVAQDAPQPTLAELKGSRPVVVFADDPEDPKFVQQMAMLEALPEELEKRRVVVLTDTDPAANGPLRRQLRPQGFGLVLIDVDGTVAHRRPLPTSVRELANFIDRTPSRRQETGSQRP
ncbi:DUF4174 domain-containing protein [Amaricoccus sp.]|uniref:DUF4174 domain-containing protein n=1 Tax=Amaricoccus sp. TaxID=1872485 RepID=UPI0026231CEE|nr:DUF4174 domain-containing protein [Amaricoccus sp.]HRO10112.1 DUF4174 domain-containing protein [Amaricoccus sp.]